jgi:hypothetical protein
MTFWEDVAEKVSGKSASECCSRYMAMFPTPAANGRQAKSRKIVQSATVRVVDDLFDATPWRGKVQELRIPEGFDLGSAIKLETSFYDPSATQASDEESYTWKPQPGMRKYVQEMTRASRRPQQAKKGKATVHEGQRTKNLRERLEVDGINMDVRMTPGGTLQFNCLRDDNADDCFGEYYGADEDEHDF